MTDKHVRRDGDDYAVALASLLPTGPAWPRDADSTLMRLVDGVAQEWGVVDGRADDLLTRETDPRSTFEMLVDWERAFGLPDPCVAEPLTIGDRQKALVAKMTTQGGQSRAYFIALAASLGYTVSITEYSPFMCGVSACGSTPEPGTNHGNRWEIGPPEMRFYWTVQVGVMRLTWFRVGDGGGQTGIDPHLRIALATDLECVFRRYKPAHTDIVFDYSGLGTPDPMAGTP